MRVVTALDIPIKPIGGEAQGLSVHIEAQGLSRGVDLSLILPYRRQLVVILTDAPATFV